MQLVLPTPKHLASYVAALQQGWSPDTTRGVEAAREALEKIEADPASPFALADDPEALGPAWKAPDGTMKARIPGRMRWMWDGAGFAGSINLRWIKGSNELSAHVDITTDPENEPSQRVILANGGVFVEHFDKGSTWGYKPGLRYRIHLGT